MYNRVIETSTSSKRSKRLHSIDTSECEQNQCKAFVRKCHKEKKKMAACNTEISAFKERPREQKISLK